MPVDALLQLQASVTKTATFNGAWLTLGGGTPTFGLIARVLYSAATNVSGANAVVFSLDVTRDAQVTTQLGEFQSDAINLSTTVQQGELFIPFEVWPIFVAGAKINPQIRLSANFSGAGSTPTITYAGDLMLSHP